VKAFGPDSVVVGEQNPHSTDSRAAQGRFSERTGHNREVPDTGEILTIGHSTHDADRFGALLRPHRVELVADVRRYPASRRHPQFNASALGAMLDAAGIGYEALGDQLGGRRRARRDSPHTGWRVTGFRAYADHMESDDFAAGLERLEDLARERRAAIMCAEGDWRRCHRRLIADALLVRGWRVAHIRPDGRCEEHRLTPFAVAEGHALTYCPSQAALDV
jgi:uncharacterized protein (DUF488 family)